ncbi:hypothetical protein ElyMa_002117000 [Elysia marginata]|uniref:Secreted protein n=1 Tax=Elysia marginata TaxID=1093978 RepID=A0AAV4FIQ6_9GAST|nr:hypothetical protein ElyMa_002117000 [Elysia marginata]
MAAMTMSVTMSVRMSMRMRAGAWVMTRAAQSKIYRFPRGISLQVCSLGLRALNVPESTGNSGHTVPGHHDTLSDWARPGTSPAGNHYPGDRRPAPAKSPSAPTSSSYPSSQVKKKVGAHSKRCSRTKLS